MSGDEPLKRELEDFVARGAGRARPAVTGEQGRAALALAERIVELMETAVEINLAIADRARAGEALTAAEIDELGQPTCCRLGCSPTKFGGPALAIA